MRTLTSTLLEAQRSGSAVPYVRVAVSDSVAGVARPVFRRLYQGAEANFHHAAACAGDGSLVRARVEPSDGRLYVQRVSSPGPSADFSTWTRLNAVSKTASIAMTSSGSTLNVFYVRPNGRDLRRLESKNNGATWSSPKAVAGVSAGAIAWVAAGVDGGGTLGVFYATTGNVVYFVEQSGQGWSSASSWSASGASITGMACAYHRDWNLAVAGTAQSSGDAKTWTCALGDGGSVSAGVWSPLREMNTARAGSGVSFHHPFMARPDVMRMTFVERYTGTSNYQRSEHTHGLARSSYADNLWREPSPIDVQSTYGVAIAASASHTWLCTPNGVWRGDRRGAAVDVTDDVLSLTAREEAMGGAAVIRLRNDHGRYAAVGEGALAPIRLGSTVSVSPGYETAVGREVSNGPAFSIEGIERVSGGGRAELVIHARTAWHTLESWRARRQYTWQSGDETLANLVRFVLAQAGMAVSLTGAGAQARSLRPSFTIHPGETAGSAARRLLEKAPVALRFRGQEGQLLQLKSTDAVS